MATTSATNEFPRGTLLAVCRSERKGTLKVDQGAGRLIAEHGLEGDAHAGPGHRQVSLIGIETIRRQAALGYPVGIGHFGENLTVEGLVLYELPVGTRLRIGEALLEVTQIGKECLKPCAIRDAVGDCAMPREGIFVRVLTGGEVRVGDIVEVL